MHSTWEHALPERDRVRELLERRGVRLYLHGHKHRRWRLEAGAMTHLNCGSAGLAGRHPERRPGYLKIHLGPARVESVRAVWLSANPPAAEAEAWREEELFPQQV
jgi:predicted phosphodiesterase